jgi:aspartyl/asparaginyl beta-hydroxylase (cupin superfamily)
VGGKKLGRITVHNVTPGGIITRHRDSGEYFKYYHRFHLPITTNSKAVFKNDYGAEENMEAQYVHLLNCRDYHEVFNYGETDRIHIMIDIALDHPNQSF